MSDASPKIISVSELNRYIAALLASKPVLQDLRIRGEISGLRRYPSGHVYFTLKDQRAAVSCVMFRSYADRLTFRPQDGQEVLAHARAGLYERDGRFQVYVHVLEAGGQGDLHAAYERMRKKLRAEGLFDEARKRPLPYLPKVIGVVTSEAGSVIRDIRNVLARRFPGFRLILAPAPVQGEGAARKLADAVERLVHDGRPDVIIIGRGGGSLEDLWAFNEEVLARAIYASPIPTISAVGHETDWTIADDVADVRAPTPSAAAELAVPVRADLEQYLDTQSEALAHYLTRRAERARMALDHLTSADVLRDPSLLVTRRREMTDALAARMGETLRRRTADAVRRLDAAGFRMAAGMDRVQARAAERLGRLAGTLDSLSPLKVLERGYGYVTDAEGTTVTSVERLATGDPIRVRLSDGAAECDVRDVLKLPLRPE